jgi:excinuclease ABC subunit C
MDLYEKIRTLPTQPGVYLYKNAEGEVIYVGKANNLRSRVRSYLLEASQANAKTGSLMREAVDLEYILVANEHEALALENNLIKQRKPRFNILLRDDKTYPYVKLTLADRFPKVFVTRRLRKDGSAYYGPYFPGNLAYRVVELIHRSFLMPSCKVDLSRYHPRACLQYYIHRCLGPCVEGLTTPEIYKEAVRDAQLFLEGRHAELERTLTARMMAAAEAEQFEAAARLRDQLSTVHQLQEKQRIATAEQDDDADVFGYHFEDGSWPSISSTCAQRQDRRPPRVLLGRPARLLEGCRHRTGPIRSRASQKPRPLVSHWETGEGLQTGASALPRRAPSSAPCSSSSTSTSNTSRAPSSSPSTSTTAKPSPPCSPSAPAIASRSPSRSAGEKRSLVDLAGQNAKQSYTQRFRVLEPSRKAIQEALADALMLPELPRRIECFDISHIQGAETVASLVVWEDGKMNKQAYRKFKVMTVAGVDDFASMRERRYKRIAATPRGSSIGQGEVRASGKLGPAF